MTAAAAPASDHIRDDQPDGLVARFGSPSLDAVVLAIALIVCVRIGMAPLQDNSFLTHLATGHLILDEGSVPSVDPYSWTAQGRSWTVQSWLASVFYAGLDSAFGLNGVRVLCTALAVGLTLVLWKLTEPAEGLVARAVAIGLALLVGTELWVERPLMFGAVGLAVVLLAAEDRLDPRFLVPVMWIWANTHGSFPFAPVVLVALGVGRFLDDRRSPTVEIRCLVWTVVGALLAVVGPLGTKALTFPFQLLGNREAFSAVREWQPLDLGSSSGKIFAMQAAVAAVAIVRTRSWRAALPAVLFSVAAATSARNTLPASIVLTPAIALGLSGLGRVSGSSRPAFARLLVHGLSAVAVVTTAMQFTVPASALEPYPQEALAWMRQEGLLDTSSRIVTRDIVGNYMTYAYGPDEVRVFIDDRVDMYPPDVLSHYLDMIRAGRDHAGAIEAVDPSAVLWNIRSELGRWLAESDEWDVVWTDDTWLVAVPER